MVVFGMRSFSWGSQIFHHGFSPLEEILVKGAGEFSGPDESCSNIVLCKVKCHSCPDEKPRRFRGRKHEVDVSR